MLAISTCWNSGRHTQGDKMIRELLRLGFTHVELGHGIRISLIEGIQKMVDQGKVTITSLHNFCPLPVEVLQASPNCYQFTSHRETERKRAVKLTKQTIDYAQRFGAKYVVMHLGSLPLPNYTDQLSTLMEEGKKYSRAFTQLKLKAVIEREKRAPLYRKRSLECMKEIVDYAAERDIHLGVESRESFEEFPTEREMIGVLDELDSPYVGYWHDIGHIQVKENLSFLDHEQWLLTIRSRMLGCHLHDVEWPVRDHRVPFSGEIDYERLIPLLPDNLLTIFELSPSRKTEEIVSAREKWILQFGS